MVETECGIILNRCVFIIIFCLKFLILLSLYEASAPILLSPFRGGPPCGGSQDCCDKCSPYHSAKHLLLLFPITRQALSQELKGIEGDSNVLPHPMLIEAEGGGVVQLATDLGSLEQVTVTLAP